MAILEVNAAMDIIKEVKAVVSKIRASYSDESLARQSLTTKLRRLEEQQRGWDLLLRIYTLPENQTVKGNFDELRTSLTEVEKVSAVKQNTCCMRLWKAPAPRQLGATLDDLNDAFDRLDVEFQEEREQLVAGQHKSSYTGGCGLTYDSSFKLIHNMFKGTRSIRKG
ncbi:hypothetical protein R1sor_025868 [Riccia sorocarpa]|uniref:Uncharacterized protein n=1 Tax=Riccia sorocarpa TaxID=122646 RepID=A0ABD3GCV5_9MARC